MRNDGNQSHNSLSGKGNGQQGSAALFQIGKGSRRNFLKSVGAGLALGLTASNYRALAGVPPSDMIQMGFVGVGGMGKGRLTEFMGHPEVSVAAICDVDESHLNRALSMAEQRQGRKPETSESS